MKIRGTEHLMPICKTHSNVREADERDSEERRGRNSRHRNFRPELLIATRRHLAWSSFQHVPVSLGACYEKYGTRADNALIAVADVAVCKRQPFALLLNIHAGLQPVTQIGRTGKIERQVRRH